MRLYGWTLLLTWVLGFAPGYLSAQLRDYDFRFEKLSAEIGLPNTGITDILEDHRGFLWMATWSGLAKYDGYAVTMYRQQPGNANGLRSNKITQLLEDQQGNLWFGTNYSGFYRYNRERDLFEQFARDPEDMNSLSNDNVSAICEDRQGNLWIGTERGLNRYNPTSGQYVHYAHNPGDSRSLSSDFVYSIAETPDGSLWVGTERGLNRLVRKDGEEYFIHYDLAPEGLTGEDYLSHNFIYKIIPSRFHEDVIWLCTSIGLKRIRYAPDSPGLLDLRYFGHNPREAGTLSHPFIPDMLEESPTRAWVATYDGLNLLDVPSGRVRAFTSDRADPHSLSNNLVRSLAKDNCGNLWIGMDKGVNKLNLSNHGFRSIYFDTDEISSNSVHCLIPSSGRQGLWVGSRGGGLYHLPLAENGHIQVLARQYTFAGSMLPQLAGFISGLLIDQEGYLWLATDGAGVFRVPEEQLFAQQSTITDYEQFTRNDELSADYIMSLLLATSGDVWIGYWDKGLDRYDLETHTFHHYLVTEDLAVNFQQYPIVHLVETVENGRPFLWLGTRGGGVYKLTFNEASNTLTLVDHYRSRAEEAEGLSNDYINAFLLDSQGRFWIGTDNGLNLLDRASGTCRSFFERDGLHNSIIQSILEDRAGNIWVSTQSGISCLHWQDDELRVKNFDAYHALQDNFFNDDAATKAPGNRLIFGGVNGLTVLRPDDIHVDTVAPKIAITDFRLSNRSVPIGELADGRTILTKSISETESIVLSHRDNVISFEFTGLHLLEPKKLRYAYQLVGFDADWVYTDASQRIAHYTNLPYEAFTFRVKAANADGYWSEPVELKLRVKPPFWLTAWAYALYTLLGIALLYLGLRVTRLRAEFRHSLELGRVEREKLEEVNQLKLQFFTNISHELRTPLTLIISPLEQLLQSTQDRKLHQLFTRMHFNANRLLMMINQLLDIRKSEAGLLKLHVAEGDLVEFSKEITASFKNIARQRNIELVFEADGDHVIAWYDSDQLEKVLFNLLSNAFKFTKDGGQVTVSVRQPGPAVITVTDTGIGIPAGQIEHIFERFYQVEKSQEWARTGGTGIGLSLAKMIMEKHHGEIAVTSEEGSGTTFRVTLRPGKSHFAEAELTPATHSQVEVPAFTLPQAPEPEARPAAKDAPAAGGGKKPLVLIVDDNPDIRAYLRENLEADYRIAEAADGREGLELALAEPPALVIADVAMPRLDGIELCSRIKSNIDTSHVPVILLTARTSLVFRVDGLETGADDYVTKPFHMRLLAARIRNLINTRQALREKFANTYDLNLSELAINSLDSRLLEQVKRSVEKHMDDSNFSVDQLATELNMSRMQLYRKLKSLTGKSPNQIIRSLRLKRAAQLLETGQFNVSDVTYMVGYVDLRSFREQFKKEFGVSPSGYTG